MYTNYYKNINIYIHIHRYIYIYKYITSCGCYWATAKYRQATPLPPSPWTSQIAPGFDSEDHPWPRKGSTAGRTSGRGSG